MALGSLGPWWCFCSGIPLLNHAEKEQNCCDSHLHQATEALLPRKCYKTVVKEMQSTSFALKDLDNAKKGERIQRGSHGHGERCLCNAPGDVFVVLCHLGELENKVNFRSEGLQLKEGKNKKAAD